MKRILRCLWHGLKDESGDALILGAVGMVAIMAFAGLAIDVGQLRFDKRQLQAAADAAALAGALEISNCGSTADCTNMQNAAKQALVENGFAAGSITVKTQCATGGSGLILIINNGPCALGSTSSDPNYGNKKYVEAEVTEVQNMSFARMIGISSETITVRSEAAAGNSPACLYTSTLPSQQSSTGMTLNGGTINSSCGIMDDSTSTGALVSDSGVSITSTSFSVAGGWSPNNGGTFSSTPKTHVATVSDPLSYLTPPEQGTLQQSGNYSPGSNATLSPGAYLGGINLNSGITLTFSPGTYYMGGSINCGGTMIGTGGVTFYFSSGSLTMNSGSTAQLVAPTSGTYAGILFYQSSTDSSAMILDGNSTSKFEGAIYAPDAQLTLNSSGNTAAYTIVDVGSVMLDSGADFVMGNNYSSLSGGSPIKGGSAVLAE